MTTRWRALLAAIVIVAGCAGSNNQSATPSTPGSAQSQPSANQNAAAPASSVAAVQNNKASEATVNASAGGPASELGDPPKCLETPRAVAPEALFTNYDIDPETFCVEAINMLIKANALPYTLTVMVRAKPDLRKKVVTDLAPVVEKLLAQPSFAARYRYERQVFIAAPANTIKPPQSGAALKKEMAEKMNKQVNDTRESAKQVPPEIRAAILQTVDEIQKQNAAVLATPNLEKTLEEQDKARFESEKASYNEAVNESKKRAAQLPEDVKAAVKLRISEFLALVKEIPFDAKLVDKNGLKQFADPKLESKPALFKAVFRVGKKQIEEAKAFAKSLNERLLLCDRIGQMSFSFLAIPCLMVLG